MPPPPVPHQQQDVAPQSTAAPSRRFAANVCLIAEERRGRLFRTRPLLQEWLLLPSSEISQQQSAAAGRRGRPPPPSRDLRGCNQASGHMCVSWSPSWWCDWFESRWEEPPHTGEQARCSSASSTRDTAEKDGLFPACFQPVSGLFPSDPGLHRVLLRAAP